MAIAPLNSVAQKITQTALNVCGGKSRVFTVNSPKAIKRIEWIGQNISSPENRLILGVTALMSQPFIDGTNKHVDEKTRKYSVARTIAKIIVGTTTGVIIRKGCIKAIDAFTTLKVTPDMKFKKLRQCLLPVVEKIDLEQLEQHKNALGTLAGLAIMMYTNFAIDAPLTKWLTNIFSKKMGVSDGKS